jgi:hypothetical protein
MIFRRSKSSAEPTLPTHDHPSPFPRPLPFSQIGSTILELHPLMCVMRGSCVRRKCSKYSKQSNENGESDLQKSPSKPSIFMIIRSDYMTMLMRALCNPMCKLLNDVSCMCLSLLDDEIQAKTRKCCTVTGIAKSSCSLDDL